MNTHTFRDNRVTYSVMLLHTHTHTDTHTLLSTPLSLNKQAFTASALLTFPRAFQHHGCHLLLRNYTAGRGSRAVIWSSVFTSRLFPGETITNSGITSHLSQLSQRQERMCLLSVCVSVSSRHKVAHFIITCDV